MDTATATDLNAGIHKTAFVVDVDIELNKVNALLFILEQQAGLTGAQALKVVEVLEQLT
jgi:hypothetical protein